MGGKCCKRKARKVHTIDNFSEESVKGYVAEKLDVVAYEKRVIIEAYCAACLKQIKKRPVRPLKTHNWKCDGCGERHSVKPGFAFYTCRKCHNDWCPNCFHLVEVAYDPNEGALLSHEEILKARVLDTESSFDRALSVDDGRPTNYVLCEDDKLY